LQGVVFVGCGAVEVVSVAVPFIVPFTESVVCGRPVRKSWESSLVEVAVAVPLLAVIMLPPTPNNVVDPKVVVRVVDPLLIVETMADVVIADVEGLVEVEEYDM